MVTRASRTRVKVEESRTSVEREADEGTTSSPMPMRQPHAEHSGGTYDFLCRLVPCSSLRIHFQFSPVVCLPSSPSSSSSLPVSDRLMSQDCFTVAGETHRILLDRRSPAFGPMGKGGGGGGEGGVVGYWYSLCSSSSLSDASFCGQEAIIQLWCPEVLQSIKALTLTGPRLHTRMSTAHLSAALLGQWVATGSFCSIASPAPGNELTREVMRKMENKGNDVMREEKENKTREGGLSWRWLESTLAAFSSSSSLQYEVTEMEMKTAGRRGIGLVGAQTIIRLNNRAGQAPCRRVPRPPCPFSSSSSPPLLLLPSSPPPVPVGLESAVQQFRQWLQDVIQRPKPLISCHCSPSSPPPSRPPLPPQDSRSHHCSSGRGGGGHAETVNVWNRDERERREEIPLSTTTTTRFHSPDTIGVGSSSMVNALLVRGPPGCGAHTVVRYCLRYPVSAEGEEERVGNYPVERKGVGNGMHSLANAGFHECGSDTRRGERNGSEGVTMERSTPSLLSPSFASSSPSLPTWSKKMTDTLSIHSTTTRSTPVSSLGLQTVIWRPGQLSIPYLVQHVVPRARVIIFLIQEASQWFPKDDPGLAKVMLRLLEKDVHHLLCAVGASGAFEAADACNRGKGTGRGGGRGGMGHILHGDEEQRRLRVAVVAVTHEYTRACATSTLDPFFNEQLLLSFPTAEERARLLAHVLNVSLPFQGSHHSGHFSASVDRSLEGKTFEGNAPSTISTSTTNCKGSNSQKKQPAVRKGEDEQKKEMKDEEMKLKWWETWLRSTALSLVGRSRRQVLEEGNKYKILLRDTRRTASSPATGQSCKDEEGADQEDETALGSSSGPSTQRDSACYILEKFAAAAASSSFFSGSSRCPISHQVQWSDIGGLKEVKQELCQALVLPHRHPDVYQRFNLTSPSGVLLYGPPGCAKTTLIKALIAAEGIFSFIYLDAASVMSAYVGESERIIRDVFHQAAQQAPCIIFFDEVEVFGGARECSQTSGSSGNRDARLLSTVLMEMDGFASSAAGRGVCFVGATNLPHLLDAALLRPGRLDRLIYIGLPDEEGRREILSHYLGSSGVPDISFLAQQTSGFTGADLKVLCAEALVEWLSGDSSWKSFDGQLTLNNVEKASEAELAISTRSMKTHTGMMREEEVRGNRDHFKGGKMGRKEGESVDVMTLRPSPLFVASERRSHRSSGGGSPLLGEEVKGGLGVSVQKDDSLPHMCPVTSFFYWKIKKFSPTVYPSDALERFRCQAEDGKVLKTNIKNV